MKIAFINIYQSRGRGAEVFAKELSTRLKKNHEVKIFSSEAHLPKRWPIIWRFFIDPQGLIIALFTLKLLPTLWRQRYNIIIPLNGGWQPAIVRLFTWAVGSKMIISGQSGKGWDDKNNLWNFPDVFVALTNEGAKWAKKINPLVKVFEIPNGADLNLYSSKKEDLFAELEKPIVLTVGALEDEKRIDLAIKAVAKLKKGSLVIVGKGSKKEYLKTLCEKYLPNRFLIKSFSHSQMPKVYKSSDLFTYPTSQAESFGIVIVEAMASGLAVVATQDPIREEIVGNAGLLVNPTNSDKYANTLSLALHRNWSDKPHLQAKKYDWDKISDKYEVLFKSFAKND